MHHATEYRVCRARLAARTRMRIFPTGFAPPPPILSDPLCRPTGTDEIRIAHTHTHTSQTLQVFVLRIVVARSHRFAPVVVVVVDVGALVRAEERPCDQVRAIFGGLHFDVCLVY